MEVSELKENIDQDFEKQLVSSRILLDHLRVIDEASRKTAAYQDPRYTPFYYHLGKHVQPANLIEVGFRLGLLSSCFLKSCKSVERFLGFQEKTDEYYSPRLGMANVRASLYKGWTDLHIGSITDEGFNAKLTEREWNLVIVNEEFDYDKHRNYLDILWDQLSLGGLIVMDYITRHEPAKNAFFDFCKIKNREPVTFRTRYGTGMVKK